MQQIFDGCNARRIQFHKQRLSFQAKFTSQLSDTMTPIRKIHGVCELSMISYYHHWGVFQSVQRVYALKYTPDNFA
jgi:hypothetical protein